MAKRQRVPDDDDEISKKRAKCEPTSSETLDDPAFGRIKCTDPLAVWRKACQETSKRAFVVIPGGSIDSDKGALIDVSQSMPGTGTILESGIDQKDRELLSRMVPFYFEAKAQPLGKKNRCNFFTDRFRGSTPYYEPFGIVHVNPVSALGAYIPHLVSRLREEAKPFLNGFDECFKPGSPHPFYLLRTLDIYVEEVRKPLECTFRKAAMLLALAQGVHTSAPTLNKE